MSHHFSHEEAKRHGGLGEIEREALTVLRLILSQAQLGQNLDAHLIESARAVINRYEHRLKKRSANLPGVIPFRFEERCALKGSSG